MKVSWFRPTAEALQKNLDLGYQTLKSVKLYCKAYGYDVKGRTKEEYMRNLWGKIKQEENDFMLDTEQTNN